MTRPARVTPVLIASCAVLIASCAVLIVNFAIRAGGADAAATLPVADRVPDLRRHRAAGAFGAAFPARPPMASRHELQESIGTVRTGTFKDPSFAMLFMGFSLAAINWPS